MRMMGAQAILEALLCEDVELIFGYPGGAIMPTYDALHRVQSTLRHVLVRHEQGAVHAAEGYARLTGKPGVCIVTSGPGATNLVTGIADAMMDSVPLVCLSGQVSSPFLGTDAFQEADIIGMTLPITKWSYQITRAHEIPGAMAKAFRLACSGRPGPVLLDITKDAQLEFLEFNYPKAEETAPCNDVNGLLDPKQLSKAASLLNQAKKPYLLVGHGVLLARAEQEILQLATKAQLPMACTLLGLSAIPSDHPLYVGMLGMHGHYAANILTNEADVIVAVGMRFDDRVTGNLATYARQAKIIHLDIDPAELNKNIAVEVSLIGDAKSSLQQLIPYVKSRQHHAWLQQFSAAYALEFEKVIAPEMQASTEKLKMAEVIQELGLQTAGEAILVTDVGQNQMVAARYYPFKHTNSHITSGGLGTMGFALPAAIGAKLVTSEREVLAIMGDGGFQMNLQELGVIAQEKLPVKMIVLNNSYLGMVRQWQELFFEKRYSFTELQNPDFVKLAEAYGIAGKKVAQRSELRVALQEMLASQGPYILEVLVEKQENVFPMLAPGAGVGEMRLS